MSRSALMVHTQSYIDRNPIFPFSLSPHLVSSPYFILHPRFALQKRGYRREGVKAHAPCIEQAHSPQLEADLAASCVIVPSQWLSGGDFEAWSEVRGESGSRETLNLIWPFCPFSRLQAPSQTQKHQLISINDKRKFTFMNYTK